MPAHFSARSLVFFGPLLCCVMLSGTDCSRDTRDDRVNLTIRVDASNVRQGIFHADLQIPCNKGKLSLHYPEWIPGEHSHNGPILQLVGIQLTAGGKPVSWQRDANDLYTIRCQIPDDVSFLDVALDYLSPSTVIGGGYGNSPNNSDHLFCLLWYSVLLYPETPSTDSITCDASLRLPSGWSYATSLPVRASGNDTVAFEQVSLTRLVDSPVMGGDHVRSIPLSEGKEAPVTLDLIGDTPEALQADALQIMRCQKMVREVDSLFGVRHFNSYHFLVSLSDVLITDGIEHHESTDIRLPERAFLDENIWKRRSYLLPHEYIHSWNGKYRRPYGLTFNDYQHSMESSMLWVYEGLTRYLDLVITGRSSLRTPDEARDYLAWAAGYLSHNRPGRAWRSLQDAAVSAQLLYIAPDEWTAWRRGWADVYDEGALVWLEVDVTIRELTGGQRSLDDFCREFHGGKPGLLGVKPYNFDDVVKSLKEIAPFDWEKFFLDRLNSHDAQPPLGGLTRAGWQVEYSDSANGQVALRERLEQKIDASWSIGVVVLANGLVQDVLPASETFQAGVAPGMMVTQVNGEKWSIPAFRKAIVRAKDPSHALDLTLQQGRRQLECRLQYHEGEKYPHLQRIQGKEDLLQKIFASRTQ